LSEQPRPGPLPELTPEQEAEVRRLLAEARHDEPIPVEVADRLDGVLAGLGRDEPGSPGMAPVIDLAARRRRRNAAALLAGAAAVVVAGFAIGQGIGTSSGEDTSAGAGSAADRSLSASGQAKEDSTRGVVPSTPPPGALESVPTPAAGGPLRLSSRHLARDVTAQLPDLGADAVSGQQYSDLVVPGCAVPLTRGKFGLGALFPALYDGTPAVLAVRPPAGDTRRADVLDCSTAQQLASATIPLP
jgi:hypothetical protein